MPSISKSGRDSDGVHFSGDWAIRPSGGFTGSTRLEYNGQCVATFRPGVDLMELSALIKTYADSNQAVTDRVKRLADELDGKPGVPHGVAQRWELASTLVKMFDLLPDGEEESEDFSDLSYRELAKRYLIEVCQVVGPPWDLSRYVLPARDQMEMSIRDVRAAVDTKEREDEEEDETTDTCLLEFLPQEHLRQIYYAEVHGVKPGDPPSMVMSHPSDAEMIQQIVEKREKPGRRSLSRAIDSIGPGNWPQEWDEERVANVYRDEVSGDSKFALHPNVRNPNRIQMIERIMMKRGARKSEEYDVDPAQSLMTVNALADEIDMMGGAGRLNIVQRRGLAEGLLARFPCLANEKLQDET